MSKLETPESDIKKDKKVCFYYLLLGILIGFVIGGYLALWYFMPWDFLPTSGLLIVLIIPILLWYFCVR